MHERVAMAQQMGLNVSSSQEGSLTTSTITIPDLQSFKAVLDAGTTSASRDAAVEKMFRGMPPIGTADQDASASGTLRRIARYLFGNDPLQEADAQRAASQFPQSYVVVTGAPSGPLRGEWCLGNKQGMQTYSLDSLDMEDGAYITVYATPIELTVKSLTRNGAPPPGWYDFNIHGATGALGDGVAALPAAATGDNGSEGSCTVSGSEPGDDGGAGSTGTGGATGNTGNTGYAGAASCSANITIEALSGTATKLSAFTQSGTGGTGGAGGTGAAGGTGGNGGEGKTCDCTGTSGGRGGDGGKGGTGGVGGTGGAGTNASGNVTFNVPAGLMSQILGKTAAAPPGAGGSGGAPGAGGKPGGGGTGGKGHSNPGSGSSGEQGTTGATGPVGPGSGLAGQIIVSSL